MKLDSIVVTHGDLRTRVLLIHKISLLHELYFQVTDQDTSMASSGNDCVAMLFECIGET